MRILLTGGAGYIGSATLRWLIERGHEAFAFDNLAEGNAQSVPADRLIEGNILDTAKLAETLRATGADAVMHFAALASVPLSISDPESYWRTNVAGTKSVLDAMKQAGVSRIVFSSTAATYSFEAEMPIRETTPQLPQTPYGTTKLAAEWMIREYARAYDLGYTILRYFNASGASVDGQHGESRHVEGHIIPLTLMVAVGRRDKLKIFGGDWDTPDGTCVRDYVHIDDLASAHQLAVEGLEPGIARAYNLGSGSGTSIKEVLQACERAVGTPIRHEVVGRRPGDPATLIASPELIIRELGWAPRFTSIDSIVETAWEWHRSHPEGYASTS